MARGSEGGNLGYGTLVNSIAIEFDSFINTENSDPNFQHGPLLSASACLCCSLTVGFAVSIHTRYTVANSANEAYSLSRSNNDPPMTLNNYTAANNCAFSLGCAFSRCASI